MLFSTPFGLTTVPPEVLLRQLEAHHAAACAAAGEQPRARVRASASNGCSRAGPPPDLAAKPPRPASPPTNDGYGAAKVSYKNGGEKAPLASSREVIRLAASLSGKPPAPPVVAPVLCTETPTALTFALDLPGRSQADVSVEIGGSGCLEFAVPAVEGKGGRRGRPALCSRAALPLPANRLDLAATSATMKDGELLVRIPKVAVLPPQTWRVPVRAAEEEAEEGRAGEAAAARAAARQPPAPAAAASDGDGSWVEASSSSDEGGENGRTSHALRWKAKVGPPPSGAVLEAVEG